MKKIFCLSIICFLVSFILTGCGSNVSTERSVKKYLKEKYPNENFTIEYYRDVTIVSSVGGCDEVTGKTWNVTSKDTGMTFYVQDVEKFNSFNCKTNLTDDYFEVYISNVINNMNDSRIMIDEFHVNDIDDVSGYGFLDKINDIKLNLRDFSSKEELAKFIVSLHDKLLSDSRIAKHMPNSFWFYVYGDYQGTISIDFKICNNINNVLEKLNI